MSAKAGPSAGVLPLQALGRAAWDAGKMDDAWGTIDEDHQMAGRRQHTRTGNQEADTHNEAHRGSRRNHPGRYRDRSARTPAREDVQAELCDVIVTAIVALSTLTDDARETFNSHLALVASRSLGTPSAAAAS
jgi:hypothetical protein